jgi:hypothetical protein
MANLGRKDRLHAALDAFLHESLHPEEYAYQTGRRLRKLPRGRVKPNWNETPGRPLPAPRYRLMRRLQMLVALKEWELQLMKEITADEKAKKDAKQYKEETG